MKIDIVYIFDTILAMIVGGFTAFLIAKAVFRLKDWYHNQRALIAGKGAQFDDKIDAMWDEYDRRMKKQQQDS